MSNSQDSKNVWVGTSRTELRSCRRLISRRVRIQSIRSGREAPWFVRCPIFKLPALLRKSTRRVGPALSTGSHFSGNAEPARGANKRNFRPCKRMAGVSSSSQRVRYRYGVFESSNTDGFIGGSYTTYFQSRAECLVFSQTACDSAGTYVQLFLSHKTIFRRPHSVHAFQ